MSDDAGTASRWHVPYSGSQNGCVWLLFRLFVPLGRLGRRLSVAAAPLKRGVNEKSVQIVELTTRTVLLPLQAVMVPAPGLATRYDSSSSPRRAPGASHARSCSACLRRAALPLAIARDAIQP